MHKIWFHLLKNSKFLAIRWSWQEAQVETTDLVKKTSTEDKKRKDLAFTQNLGWFINLQRICLYLLVTNSFTQILEQQ
jgi:iron complex outermembrane receptor protein